MRWRGRWRAIQAVQRSSAQSGNVNTGACDDLKAAAAAARAVLYLALCAYAEVSVLRGSCRHCCYYGRLCAFGRGRLCALLLSPGDPQRFLQRRPSVRDILADILVAAAPVLGGVVLFVREFDWVLLGAAVVVVFLATVATGAIRGRLACPHCRQRELGCPAEQFFSRRRSTGET